MSAERASRFVDSNVLIYAHDRTAADRHVLARDLLNELWRSHAGVLSVQVLQEFFVNISGKIGTSEARRLVADYSTWRTHTPDAKDVVEAIDIHRDYKISFWDAMIVRSASELRCDVLVTEDLNSGQTYRGVRVENPFL
jgi:predicted nucleic acid-binding protein